MRSKLCAITARTPSSLVPLAAQSRDEPVPYSRPAKTTSGALSLLVAHRRVVDRHPLARGVMEGVAAFDHGARRVLHHLVLDADVGEGAAHHHFVIAAARAVLVEIGRAHLMLDQILPGRARCADRARRRDVVGGDRSRNSPRMRALTMSSTGFGVIVMPSK